MCCENCCCKNIPPSKLIYILIIFSLINFILTFTAVFIRGANTKRYKQALIYLDEINNGTFKNYTFNYTNLGHYMREKYCIIDGEILLKPGKEVRNQSLFKNWDKIELILNICNLIINGIYFSFLIFVFIKIKNKKIKNVNSNNIKKINKKLEKNDNLFILLIIFLIFLIFISSLFIVIRSMALSANEDIALYNDDKQNSFEENIAYNYIVDIINIVLNSIAIGLVFRMKNSLNNKQVIFVFSNVNQNPQPQPIQKGQIQVYIKDVEITQQPTLESF